MKKHVIFLLFIQIVTTSLFAVLWLFVSAKQTDAPGVLFTINLGKMQSNSANNVVDGTGNDKNTYSIKLEDNNNKMDATGTIKYQTQIDVAQDFRTYIKNILGINRKWMNAQVNLVIKEREASISRYASVKADRLNVRLGPSLTSYVFYVLKDGDIVEVCGKIGNWSLVYFAEQNISGSVYGDFLKPVQENK